MYAYCVWYTLMAAMTRERPIAGLDLPASFKAAWGEVAPTSRGPRRELSLDRIVAAAVRVASADGIGAVSMGRVAGELGAGTMALYRYVGTKDELLTLMVDAAFGRPGRAPSAAATWRPELTRWARDYLTVLERHPWIVRIPLSGPPMTPSLVAWFEQGLAALGTSGLSAQRMLAVLTLVNGFVRNHATLAADLRMATPDIDDSQAGAWYANLLDALTGDGPFPAIRGLLRDRAFDGSEDLDADFRFGLSCILDGVEVLIDNTKRRRSRPATNRARRGSRPGGAG